MRKMAQTGLIISTVFISLITFGQAKELEAKKTNDGVKTAKTYFDLMVNVVSTNLNYGASNGAVADYKKATDGVQAGVSFQAGITPAFSLVTELYYLRKGGELKSNNPATIHESTLRLNTLELPLLARFHVGKFYMNAGPSIAYNFSGSHKIDHVSTKLSFGKSGEGFKRFDAGLQVGGGIAFPIKEKRIALDIRYAHGLTNISYDRQLYNRAILIGVHFSKSWKRNPLARSNNF
jgi:hypothetical protein